MEWDKTVWESSLDLGLHTLRLAVDTHAITSHFALPLLIRQPGGLVVEVTDGTAEYNADATTASRSSTTWPRRPTCGWPSPSRTSWRRTARRRWRVTPGWLRSEAMLEAYGVTEANWRDATARSSRTSPSPRARRSSVGRRRAGRRSRRGPLERPVAVQRAAGPGLRLHRSRRQPARRLALRRRRSRTPASPPTRPATADRWRPRSPPRSSPDCGRSASPCPMPTQEDAWVGTRWRVRRKTFAHVLAVDDGWPPAYARAAGSDGPMLALTFRSSGPELEALSACRPPVLQAGVVPGHRRHGPRRRDRLGGGGRAAHRELLRPGAAGVGGDGRSPCGLHLTPSPRRRDVTTDAGRSSRWHARTAHHRHRWRPRRAHGGRHARQGRPPGHPAGGRRAPRRPGPDPPA